MLARRSPRDAPVHDADASVYSDAMSRARRVALVAMALAASAQPGMALRYVEDAHAAAPDTSASASAATPATLVIAERTVIVFRASFGAIHPAERRERAERIFNSVISAMRADSVHVDTTAYGHLLICGDRPLFTVTPGDADTLAGETFDGVTDAARRAATEAIRAGVHDRDPGMVAMEILFAVLGTVVLLILLRIVVRLDERIAKWLQAFAEKRMERLTAGIGSTGRERLIHTARNGIHAAGWLFSLVLVYLWLMFTLRRFPATAPFGNALRGLLWNSAKGVVMSGVHALPGLATVLVIVILTRFAARLLGMVFSSIESGAIRVPWIHPDTAVPTRRIATTILWLFGFMAAYPYIPGSETDVFKGASVLIGALLSFGSSGVVSQAMNGFVLMYSRSFKKGEFVHVGEIMGTVSEVGLLSTKITTPRNEELTIPNSLMVGSITTNDSRLAAERGLYLNTTVTIGYDAPWRQVHAMLIEAARRTSGLRRTPEPFVLQRSLADFYVEYVLAAQIEEPARRMLVLAELHQNIQDQFNEYGVQIMSPHYENDRSLGPPMVPKSQWWAPPAARPDGGPAAPGAS
jgi:small-conductance mechanosensitive channel